MFEIFQKQCCCQADLIKKMSCISLTLLLLLCVLKVYHTGRFGTLFLCLLNADAAPTHASHIKCVHNQNKQSIEHWVMLTYGPIKTGFIFCCWVGGTSAAHWDVILKASVSPARCVTTWAALILQKNPLRGWCSRALCIPLPLSFLKFSGTIAVKEF